MPSTGVAAESARGLSRDLALLDALADAAVDGGLRLTDLAALTGRDKSQVSRALYRLAEAGLVAQAVDGRTWQLGWKLFALAAHTVETGLVALSRPVMRRLVEDLGETVHLCVLRGLQVLTLHSEVPPHGFRGLGWIGVSMPAHATSAGRVLLAALPTAELERLYPDDGVLPEARPSSRLQTRADLFVELTRIRDSGVAVVREELEPGLVGASAAMRDFRGIAVASLNVAAPGARLSEQLDDVAVQVLAAAAAISDSLGSPTSRPDTAAPPLLTPKASR